MLEILFFPFWAMLFLRRGRFDGAVFYNYSISFALLAVLFRARGIPYIAQVEDIAVPAKADWKPGSETRPAQQLLYWLCMKVVSGLSVGIWVPSQRFLTFLPRSKPYLVVRGCVADSEWGEDSPARLLTPIRVLFVGKYEIEHGLDLFVAALEFLRSGAPVGRLYEFDCCGTRDYPAELRSLSAGADRPVIRLHGLLSDDEYRKLLAETAVALVLQKGQGRHANLKSPSKAHEFLAAGKLVIATDVGDLALNSGSQLIMLKDESPEELVRIFEDIAKEPEKYEKIALAARKYSRRESSYVAVGTKLVAFLTRAFISSQPRGT
jgi:glycosyltransferase involved in cell wall biosynthesis